METAIKRLGKSPQELGTVGYFGGGCDDNSCPDILETENGDFIIIGKDVTGDVNLNGISGLAPNERAVLIPRITLTSAKKDIP
ncbi:hypothetical protein [Pedobacter sp. MC2016-24]|uniref:hypothetical protein n=1 Tax=Pedobacter sp. MC2016-24 TaxID=2780090 RepID=UPI00187FB929|nr:hypothetical protein [Pedobacter sp. MC2016-24]MBE9602658.1 hypothetical protein [Pedobacter sp. MC2016-24]